MGLDMYLSAKLYTSKYQEKATNKKIWKMFKEVEQIDNLDSAEVKLKVGYWRKANAIHKWFVEVVQEGEDECRAHDVSREQLKELMELCKEVLANKEKAKDLLPTQNGFFYGNTEYGEFYFEDLENTIKIIERCLKLPENWDIEYRSSW